MFLYKVAGKIVHKKPHRRDEPTRRQIQRRAAVGLQGKTYSSRSAVLNREEERKCRRISLERRGQPNQMRVAGFFFFLFTDVLIKIHENKTKRRGEGFERWQQQRPLCHNSNIFGPPKITDLILYAFYDAVCVCVVG